METTDLKQAASGAADRSRSFISSQLDERSTQLGKTVSATAEDLRRIADELRSSGTVPGAADLANRAAETVEGLGRYLQSADGDQLISDAEAFARERPWAIATAALALGFATSRFLKASSAERYRSRYGSGSQSSYRDGSSYRDRSSYGASSYGASSYGSSSAGESARSASSDGGELPNTSGASPAYAS